MTYSSLLAANRGRFMARNQNTTSFRGSENALGPVSNTIMLIVLACLLGLLYLTQVTKTNAYSYRINELQKRHEQLQSEHTELEVASARLQALERVKNSEQAKSLAAIVPSGTIQQ